MDIPNTKLTRREYTAKANEWIKNNPQLWQRMKSKGNHYVRLTEILTKIHGRPFWRDQPGRNNITGTLPTKDDPGTLFQAKGQINNKVQFQSGPTRKATRGNTVRNETTVTTSRQEFLDFGKRNGYSAERSNFVYDRYVERNRAQIRSVPPGSQNDHFNPHKSKFNSAGENYRSMVDLPPPINGAKSDKLPTRQEMVSNNIPTSKQSLIRMEFNDVAPPNPKVVRAKAAEIASDSSRITARQNNARLDAATVRREQFLRNIRNQSPTFARILESGRLLPGYSPPAKPKPVKPKVSIKRTPIVNAFISAHSSAFPDSGFNNPGDEIPFGGRTVSIDPLFTGATIRLP